MKNKKGFLLGEKVTNIILAVLVCIVLFTLGAKLYSLSQDKSNFEKAEIHLERIMEKINKVIESGEPTTYYLYSPNEWVLVGWPQEEQIPDKCALNDWSNCICLCALSGSWTWGDFGSPVRPTDPSEMLEECNNLGTCKMIEKDQKLIVQYHSRAELEGIFVQNLLDNNEQLEIKLEEDVLKISPVSNE